MRHADLESLRRPFTTEDDPELAFPISVGINVPEVELLYREIFSDLDEANFGVGWWAPHPGTSRRILISHYLLECVRSIRHNLTEAGLHLLEAVDNWDKESDFLADCVSTLPNRTFSIHVPPRRCPEDDLARRLATLHAVGFFRALVGALDCLGASIVGVLALPKNIQYADLKVAKDALRNATYPIQSDFASKLNQAISDAGPKGWIEWLTDFRNMAIHRGRRFTIAQVIPRRPPLLGPTGKVIPRAMRGEHLPSDPCRSQVEAFLDEARPGVLTEHAEATIRGALDSSVVAIRNLCAELVTAWRTRRSYPSLINQPRENWPGTAPSGSTQFNGYRPGTLPFDPAKWAWHRDIGKQFKSAALSDDLRHLWSTFD